MNIWQHISCTFVHEVVLGLAEGWVWVADDVVQWTQLCLATADAVVVPRARCRPGVETCNTPTDNTQAFLRRLLTSTLPLHHLPYTPFTLLIHCRNMNYIFLPSRGDRLKGFLLYFTGHALHTHSSFSFETMKLTGQRRKRKVHVFAREFCLWVFFSPVSFSCVHLQWWLNLLSGGGMPFRISHFLDTRCVTLCPAAAFKVNRCSRLSQHSDI